MAGRKGLARKAADEAKGARWCLGSAYEPLHRVQDVRSSGRKSRIEFNGRPMHFLSDLEVRAFRHFQWEPSVFGIEEQYYLEIEDTVRIAEEAGASHPITIGTDDPFEMSTDLVIYFRVFTGERRLARQIKSLKDIQINPAGSAKDRKKVEHTLEKLEIERRYWSERNVNWAILTERELTETRTRNIENLLDAELDPTRPEGFWQDAVDHVTEAIAGGEGLRIVDLQRGLDASGTVEPHDFTACVRYLCRERVLFFDMETRFELTRPVTDFEFAASPLKLVC